MVGKSGTGGARRHIYDRFDGAQPYGAPTSTRSRSLNDGRVWFASGVVVQVVDPSTFRKKRYRRRRTSNRLSLIEGNSRPQPILRSPRIPATCRLITPRPRSLIPQRVRFRYRLDGYDHDWHEAGTRRQAFYTDLRPGKYSFRVIACNSEGVWGASPAKLDFS